MQLPLGGTSIGASRSLRDLLVNSSARSPIIIAEAPRRWPAGVHGTRRFLLHRFPFAVAYRELRSIIQVLAVAHARRRPGYWRAPATALRWLYESETLSESLRELDICGVL